MIVKTRVTLYAEEGKLLTDGLDFYEEVLLAKGANKDDYREVTKEEARALGWLPEEELLETLV